MEIYFEVIGKPTPQQRHRHRGKFTYDPSSKDKERFLFKCIKHRPLQVITTPLRIQMEFVFDRPKSHYKSGKYSNILREDAPVTHTFRPDTDNLIKFVLDSLNKIFYKDDSQACEVMAIKRYIEQDEEPKTEVMIQTHYGHYG